MENEKRLIDANALIANGWHIVKTGKSNVFLASMSLADVPTVDAVEVVRCKDCKHRGEEGECPMYFVTEIEWDDDGYTEYDYVPYDCTVDDGFCYRGERREA